jgi:hypothetical protein
VLRALMLSAGHSEVVLALFALSEAIVAVIAVAKPPSEVPEQTWGHTPKSTGRKSKKRPDNSAI